MRMRIGHDRVMLLTGCPYGVQLALIGAALALNGSVPPYGKIRKGGQGSRLSGFSQCFSRENKPEW